MQATATSSPNKPLNPLLSISEVVELTSIGKTAIYMMAKAGKFPRQVKLTQRTARWKREEVETWLKNLKASDTPQTKVRTRPTHLHSLEPFEDTATLASVLRTIHRELSHLGHADLNYYLPEAAAHLEGLHATAKRFAKKLDTSSLYENQGGAA